MSDFDFTPVPAIPVPPEAASPAQPAASRPNAAVLVGRLAFAVFVPLVLYVEAGSGYFLTACRPMDIAASLHWTLFILIVLPFVSPIPFVMSLITSTIGAVAFPYGSRAIRIRNRFALGLAVVVPVGALIAGALVPSQCSLGNLF